MELFNLCFRVLEDILQKLNVHLLLNVHKYQFSKILLDKILLTLEYDFLSKYYKTNPA